MLRHLLAAAALAAPLVLTASDAPAGCGVGGVSAFPRPGGTLAANGRVVVEGHGNMAAAVAAIDGEALVLASEGDEIPLRPVTVYRGDWNAAEAVLAPARELVEGARYVLRASAAAQGSALDVTLRRDEPMRWAGAARIPDAGLQWTARPVRGDKVTGGLCPPHAYVNVRVAVDHPEHLLGVVAEVRALQARSTPKRFLVEPRQGQIALGFLGCSAPLVLAAGVPHFVTFTAVDLAGRETPAPGGPIVIVGPKQDP